MELKPVPCGLFHGMCRDAVPGGLFHGMCWPCPLFLEGSLILCCSHPSSCVPCLLSSTCCSLPHSSPKHEGRKAQCPGEETGRSRGFYFNLFVAVAEQLWEECPSSGIAGGRDTWRMESVAPGWTSRSRGFSRGLHLLNHCWFVDLDFGAMF